MQWGYVGKQSQKSEACGAKPEDGHAGEKSLHRQRLSCQLERALVVVLPGLATKGCCFWRPSSGLLLLFQSSERAPRSRVSFAGRLQPDPALSANTVAAPVPDTEGRLAFFTLSSWAVSKPLKSPLDRERLAAFFAALLPSKPLVCLIALAPC